MAEARQLFLLRGGLLVARLEGAVVWSAEGRGASPDLFLLQKGNNHPPQRTLAPLSGLFLSNHPGV